MKDFLKGGLTSIIIAMVIVAADALAGGFPSRPFFQSIGVGMQAPATAGQLQTTGNATIGGALSAVSASTTGNAVIGGSLSANGSITTPGGATLNGGVVVGGASGSGAALTVNQVATGSNHAIAIYGTPGNGVDITYHSGIPTDDTYQLGASETITDSFQLFDQTNGTVMMTVNGNTVVNFPSGTLEAHGRPETAAVFGGNPTCTITAGALNAASCSRTAQGQYTLTFSTAYPNIPACVASDVYETPGNIPIVVDISTISTTSVSVWAMASNTTGTGFDGTIYLICR